MLEASDRHDRGDEYDSPLKEIDPQTLETLQQRIDTGALALGQVPQRTDVDEMVRMLVYWRLKFVAEEQAGMANRRQRRQAAANGEPPPPKTKKPKTPRLVADNLEDGL